MQIFPWRGKILSFVNLPGESPPALWREYGEEMM